MRCMCDFRFDLRIRRFQAPGERVELVKSRSQPHLNGLSGFVDFSGALGMNLWDEGVSVQHLVLRQCR